MKCVGKNETLRIFYAADKLTSGLSVVFNIWSDAPTLLYQNQAALSEVGNEGIYYFDLVTPNFDLYLLIIASNSGVAAEAQIVKVGSPSSKAFYVHGNFESGRTMGYEIYDSANSVLASDNLTDVIAGFYSASTQGLAEPWFFEVFPWTVKNKPCS